MMDHWKNLGSVEVEPEEPISDPINTQDGGQGPLMHEGKPPVHQH